MIAEDMVWVTTYNFYGSGEIMAYDIEDTNSDSIGELVWQPLTIERSDSTPVYQNGKIYVCGGAYGFSTEGERIYCIDVSTRTITWQTPVELGVGNWSCSPAVADGLVFAGKPESEPGMAFDYQAIYALDADTGAEVWHYDHGGASPSIADGKLFTVGEGKVWVFGPDWDINGDGSINIFDITFITGPDHKNLNTSEFAIARLDRDTKKWVELPQSSADPVNKVVTASLNCLTPLTIIANIEYDSPALENNENHTPSVGNIEDNSPAGAIASLTDGFLISPDNMAELLLPHGNTQQHSTYTLYEDITLAESVNPEEIPPEVCRIGLEYEIRADSLNAGTPATLKLHYRETVLSDVIRWDTNGDGMADLLDDDVVTDPEYFYIVCFNADTGKWDPLPGKVDTGGKMVTAEIAQSGRYALFGPSALPLVVESIQVVPSEIARDDQTTISITVENPGSGAGAYILPVKIDGYLEYTREIKLEPGKHTIAIEHSEPYPGSHSVSAFDAEANFFVSEKAAVRTDPENTSVKIILACIGGVLLCIGAIVTAIWFKRAG
ncbi:MAG: PQQ-binding-like beta-propeller repeat protein [Dehalococcoidales bacterium]|nr:PQQ-binding-like beta-propeller repeat protein [Dehalococcoidales bacterium]